MALRYEGLVTPVRVKIALTLAVVYPIALYVPCAASSHNWSPEHPCMFALVFPPWTVHVVVAHVYVVLVAVVILYVLILRQALGHQRRIAAQHNAGHTDDNQLQATSIRDGIEVMKHFALIIGVFVFTMLPFFILTQVIVHDPAKYLANNVVSNIYTVSQFALITNNFINPVIYALKFKSYRSAFRTLIRCSSPAEWYKYYIYEYIHNAVVTNISLSIGDERFAETINGASLTHSRQIMT